MVNGFWVIPPLSRVGASVRSGEATKFPFRSSTIAYGRTCSSTEYHVHVAEEQLVMGLMHSGHCSAPMTMDPPRVGPLVGLAEEPVVAFPPQATATRPATAVSATVGSRMGNRISFLLPRARQGAAHGSRSVSGRYFRVRRAGGSSGVRPRATVAWATQIAWIDGPD